MISRVKMIVLAVLLVVLPGVAVAQTMAWENAHVVVEQSDTFVNGANVFLPPGQKFVSVEMGIDVPPCLEVEQVVLGGDFLEAPGAFLTVTEGAPGAPWDVRVVWANDVPVALAEQWVDVTFRISSMDCEALVEMVVPSVTTDTAHTHPAPDSFTFEWTLLFVSADKVPWTAVKGLYK